MTSALYVGYLAATLGTVCWIPQAWKAWSTRDTSGISLVSNLLFLTTVSLWLLYGLMVTDWPIIAANICAIIAVTVIVAAKLKYK
ncbi:SemiSWEET family sugar transporter [Lentibacter sp. XHP0401]|jgi:MtN3 and saliva related transmembrane protein|uniref:SemiSWEET family sugar transporter n=1 Tax=Lentibacter sp. XHP0401 TaxID=2984334 RepID=UPI0021E7BEC3|nr:SemiSWEET transporter [Lentibacter sp. XHP0401]MCV2893461.1 SemiSWEET transporter [Lentibacter sp. XHP0401]